MVESFNRFYFENEPNKQQSLMNGAASHQKLFGQNRWDENPGYRNAPNFLDLFNNDHNIFEMFQIIRVYKKYSSSN